MSATTEQLTLPDALPHDERDWRKARVNRVASYYGDLAAAREMAALDAAHLSDSQALAVGDLPLEAFTAACRARSIRRREIIRQLGGAR